ncbi:MAG: hypothetical protein QOJ96_2557 [Alphaproteobacteria bacterium]|nr:hypothetical protein [Alphaproteobacteria bacterium]
MFRHSVMLAAAGALLALSGAEAKSQDAASYPNRTVRIVVSAPPGGGVDIVARIIADKLAQRYGQTFVVENHAGAAGNLGSEAVAAAPADGYTLLAAQPAPLTTNIILYKKLNFDPVAFEPIAVMTTIPNMLIVRPDFPANSASEFIAYAKANPGKLNYASQGAGTTPHLTAELFQRDTGTKLVHVPYKGTAQAVNDLIASHVDLMFLEMGAGLELHRAGKARILAVTTLQRLDVLPDIPTLDDVGVTGFRSDTWNALAAPPKTPRAIVTKLNGAINDLFKLEDVQSRLLALSMQPVGGSPEEMAKFLKSETQRWGDVIRAANITAN